MKINIGAPQDRVDGRLKVTGGAKYAAEVEVANVAHAVIVSSAIASGRVASLDTKAAEAAPGVLAVYTHANAMKVKAATPSSKSPTDRVLQILQDDLVHYARQPIAVVVADTLDRARHAADLVVASYAAAKPGVELDARIADATLPSKPSPQAPADVVRGDLAKGLAAAATKIEARYTTPFETHNPMEPHATIAAWAGERLTLYDSTQGVFEVRRKVSESFGIPKEDVRVISHFVGGGFGCKGSVWSHVLLAAMAAKQLGRPVKLVLTRQQMFGLVGGRPRIVQPVILGATRDGKLTAIRHDSTSANSKFDEFVEHTTAPTRELYACPNLETHERIVALDIGTPTFTRAPGESTGSFAMECAMDELAYALGKDPLALRLANYADKDPQSGKPWSSKSLKECYARASEAFGWSKRTPKPRSMKDGRMLIGQGMATATYPAHLRPASALVRYQDDGRVTVLAGSQDIGTGTYTILAQIAADTLGVDVERVHVDIGDTDLPETPTSGGSQTAASVGSAVRAAGLEARKQLLNLARTEALSPVKGAAEEDVVIDAGHISLRSKPEGGEPIDALLKRAKRTTLEAKHENKPSKDREQFGTRAFGAQFVEVRVDPDLGEVRVTRVVSAFACGKILNVKTARSQMLGGIVWGIGMALHEATVYDTRLGRVMNADLAEYHVPTNADVPPIDVIFVDEVDPHVNELGIKGAGEIPITGLAAAIANAVYHATGKRVRDLPITLDKLL